MVVLIEEVAGCCSGNCSNKYWAGHVKAEAHEASLASRYICWTTELSVLAKGTHFILGHNQHMGRFLRWGEVKEMIQVFPHIFQSTETELK